MKCAIMQPTYLPWAGYFSLLSTVDTFVFLDDVQFSKGSWQQRNRILLNGKEHYLTVPILKKGKSTQLISEVKIDHSKPWKRKHLQTLKQAYIKYPFAEEIIPLLKEWIDSENKFLVDLNIKIIKVISEKLDLHPTFVKSSDIAVSGKRSEYLINICQQLRADTYISPPGSKQYIDEEDLFAKSDINIEYFSYSPQPYLQVKNSNFISHLSIVDMIANIGFEETKNDIGGKGNDDSNR